MNELWRYDPRAGRHVRARYDDNEPMRDGDRIRVGMMTMDHLDDVQRAVMNDTRREPKVDIAMERYRRPNSVSMSLSFSST
jgi:hypothetical protein